MDFTRGAHPTNFSREKSETRARCTAFRWVCTRERARFIIDTAVRERGKQCFPGKILSLYLSFYSRVLTWFRRDDTYLLRLYLIAPIVAPLDIESSYPRALN